MLAFRLPSIRTKLNARFARINRQKEKGKEELGFQAVDRRYPPCRNCGKHGHPHWKCPSKPKNGVTSKSCLEIYTNKLCYYCGKSGHKLSECRLRKKHQEEKGEKAKLAKSESENPGCDDKLAFVCHEVTKNENNETMHQS